MTLTALPPARVDAETSLSVRGLTVKFGGHTAVKSLDLEAPAGRITGLIGPNGAGKTTTFNACTGFVKPTSGSVTLSGENISGLAPQARAQHGLGRTFQRIELFDSMDVRTNLALAREFGAVGSKPWKYLRAPSADLRAAQQAADEALAMCGIEHLGNRQAADLSTGQQRLVELARCIAGGFTTMLLDEPSAGLDKVETAAFEKILVRLVDERGVGILIVEHDMALVMSVCDYIYVLDFGQLIAEGTPDVIQSSPVVRAAYLGADDVAPDEDQEL